MIREFSGLSCATYFFRPFFDLPSMALCLGLGGRSLSGILPSLNFDVTSLLCIGNAHFVPFAGQLD